MLYCVVNGKLYQVNGDKRIPDSAKVTLDNAKLMKANPSTCDTVKVGEAEFLVFKPAPKPKAEVKTQEGEEDCFSIAASLRELLPFDAEVRREGSWCWVYNIAKSDKDSHAILKAHNLRYSKYHEAGDYIGGWAWKPGKQMRGWKGYRNAKSIKHEVEAL